MGITDNILRVTAFKNLLLLLANMKRSSSKERNVKSGRAPPEAVPPQTGLDVEFAKALRDFFVKMRDVQNGMAETRNYGMFTIVILRTY